MPPTSGPRRVTLTGVLMALAGVVLLAVFVSRIGPAAIAEGFAQIGAGGLLLIVLLGGSRFAARALAWSLALEPPHRLPFTGAFNALVCGDTLGNVTPLGPIVSEPAKLAYVRLQVPLGPAVTALAIENVLYTLSVAAMVGAGAVALLFAFELPSELRITSEVALGAVAAGFAVVVWLIWRRPAILSRAVPRFRAAEQDIYTFATRRRGAAAAVVALELAFHALGVLEMYVTLWMLQGSRPRLLLAFVLEASSRLITVAFKFIPFQGGVLNTGLAGVTAILGSGSAIGGIVSLVRQVRMVAWSLVGTALLVRRGLSTRRILEDESLQFRR